MRWMISTRPLRSRLVALSTTFAFALATIAPSIAAADSSDVDVALKSGAQYHGKLVEKVPGDHLTIQLATGEIKRFEWSDLADQADEDDSEAAPPKKPKPAPTQTTTSADRETFYVSIHTEQEGVVLERLIGSSSLEGGPDVEHWTRVCTAPCNIEVPAGSDYRIGGHGLRKSPTFTIDRSTEIDAKLGTPGGLLAGVILTSVGGLLALTGVAIGGASNTNGSSVADSGSGDKQSSNATTAAWVVGASGLVMVVVGVVVLLGNANSVSVNRTAIAKKKQPPSVGGLRLTPTGFVF